jgi:uncharacterized membrane protein
VDTAAALGHARAMAETAGPDVAKLGARHTHTGRTTMPITSSIEVARPVDQVFAYVTDPSTMPEWQQGCVSGHMDAPTTRIGSRCTTVRKIGGG